MFSYIYLIILIIVVLISIAMPIDRAMDYIRIVAVIFAVITLTSMAGICVFLGEAGFYPPVQEYDPKTDKWFPVTDEGPYFSILTLSGVLMLSVYLIPFLLRPLDFVFNFFRYILGFLSYLFMLPVFINIMQVYSMSNLHDVSWGNRPSANAGTGMISIHAKKQQELKGRYEVFRVNVLAFWIACNAAFAIVIESYGSLTTADAEGRIRVNDGTLSFLQVFAIYLAALVTFRLFFGTLHILKFKFRMCCV